MKFGLSVSPAVPAEGAQCLGCCAVADGQSGRAALAVCAARRWLARNAAGVKLIHAIGCMEASACISLVSCLPALQDVTLCLDAPLVRQDLGRLLEALGQCPRLTALNLALSYPMDGEDDDAYPHILFPDAAAFAKLGSLTKLALDLHEEEQFCLADVVSALVPLTGLAELHLEAHQADGVPAALGQLKSLRSLTFKFFQMYDLEAGCLDLPNLLSLTFDECRLFEGAQMLPGIGALQRLTRIEFMNHQEEFVFDPQLVQLQRLQHLIISPVGSERCHNTWRGDSPGLFGLPADMGALRASLLHLEMSWLGLLRFPLALTQLAALESLDASDNHFAELPTGITALSRLTELRLGRMCFEDTLQLVGKRRLDARALGDLSGFPALRKLTLMYCEVMLCPSLLGAVRHASLAKLSFYMAHPAPECAPVVLQLSRELGRLGRGSVVRFKEDSFVFDRDSLGRACRKFKADLDACGQ